MNTAETIITRLPDKKHGISINSDLYYSLVDFIIRSINDDRHATLMSLLVDGETRYPGYPNFYWFLIHVKLDLEAKGLIRAEYDRVMKGNFLKITHEGHIEFKMLLKK